MKKIKRISMGLVVWLLLSFISVSFAQDNTSILTKNCIKTSELDVLNYLLYTPENVAENMPLIVYLHGGSGKGDDLDLITSVEGFPKYVQDKRISDIPAYIIFPQVPSTKRGWAEIKVSVKELIEYVCAVYSIDETRISLTGHSMGGTGTWNMALSYPDIFSCIAPMSGSITNTADKIDTLSKMPIWAFVGSADTIVPPDSSINFIAALKAKNKQAKITVFDEATHFDVPELAYLDNKLNVVNWLIDNVREKESIEFSSDIVTVNIEIPGKYSLIFADYEKNGQLNKIGLTEQEFNLGENKIMVPEDITLGINDKIMLWKNTANMQPICKSYTIQ